MNKWKRFWGHLRTIRKHRRAVRKLCFKCGLYWQGLTHDLSKYSHTEFWNGVKYFTGTASPHVGERKAKGYSDAWLHHHNRNKHHAEYWQDIQYGHTIPIEMPLRYLAEMICDRVAASMIYLGEDYTDAAAWEYYLLHLTENEFHEHTRNDLQMYLYAIKRDGLNTVMKDLKRQLRENK